MFYSKGKQQLRVESLTVTVKKSGTQPQGSVCIKFHVLRTETHALCDFIQVSKKLLNRTGLKEKPRDSPQDAGGHEDVDPRANSHLRPADMEILSLARYHALIYKVKTPTSINLCPPHSCVHICTYIPTYIPHIQRKNPKGEEKFICEIHDLT